MGWRHGICKLSRGMLVEQHCIQQQPTLKVWLDGATGSQVRCWVQDLNS